MRGSLENIAEIERYLLKEMTAEEVKAFEALMAADPEIANQVEEQRLLQDAFRRKMLYNQIQSVALEHSGGRWYKGWTFWSVVAVVVASVCFLGLKYCLRQDGEGLEMAQNNQISTAETFKPVKSDKAQMQQSDVVPVTAVEEILEEEEAVEIDRAEPQDEQTEIGVSDETVVVPDDDDGSEGGGEVTPGGQPPITKPAQQAVDVDVKSDTDDKPIVDEVPEVENRPASFPGGESALKAYIENFAVQNRWRKKTGVIEIDFVVDHEGKVSEIIIIRGLSKKINDQAVLMVESMPDWIPAVKDGVPVESSQRLPIILEERGD